MILKVFGDSTRGQPASDTSPSELHVTPQQMHSDCPAHACRERRRRYLINSLTLENALWTLGPPCAALSCSWTLRCLSGVKVKERYAPERSSLVRMAFLRIRDGEEDLTEISSWLLCGSSADLWLFFCRCGSGEESLNWKKVNPFLGLAQSEKENQ